MIAIREAEEVKFEKILLKVEDYAELVAGIRKRMEEVSYAQGCNRYRDESGSLPLVRVDEGDGVGG